MVKIFIDPGHGGSDPGASANGLVEKDLVLTISKDMQSILENYSDVEVRLSREDDSTVPNDERAEMANNWGADYYISVHVNAGGGTGFESYIHTSRASDTVSKQEEMHTSIVDELDVRDRGKKEANFTVLSQTAMSAILTENLFVDHDADAEKLQDRSFLTEIAEAHVNGIASIFNLEKKETDDEENGNNDDYLYKVQVGAFADEENAKNLAEELESKGYETIIKKEPR